MKVLEIILPVLVMILLGMACKRLKLLDQNGINNMKLLVTQIMLPVAIFHALATSEYNKETGILVGIMFVMLVVSFSIGFLLRPLMPAERYRKYLPFMVSVYEGGSMAYPLYTSLCGAENLSQIAVLDIAGLLFGFSVYMGMLGQVENGERLIRETVFQCNTYTGVIASVLGIIAGLTGVVQKLLAGPFAGTYTSVENILTTSITSVILLVVGFSIEFDKKLLSPCIRTIVLRILLQAVMIGGVLLAIHYIVGDHLLLNLAVISYMSAPATFSMQTFLKSEDGSAYVSTTNSLYCLVSILVYVVMAFVVY